MQNPRLSILTYVILFYMLLAFVWWSVLLYTKNRDAYLAKVELLQIGMAAEGLIRNREEFVQSERFQELNARYQRQEYMIIGESIFLILSLLAGMYLIYRAYLRELRASRQQRNFLLSITHELKSPIASIRLILETLQRRQLTPEQSQKLSDNALQETDRLTNLVEDLLLSAKLESAYEPNLTAVDLSEMLRDLIRKLEIRHPEATFIVEEKDHIPAIQADRQGLVSVFLNLLENAVKYSPSPAHITVSLDWDQADRLCIRIADHGYGIPNGEKKRVFQKFYRIGNEDTRQTKGTGLGLYIVSEIVKAHGGDIQIRDNEGGGAVFEIALPEGRPA